MMRAKGERRTVAAPSPRTRCAPTRLQLSAAGVSVWLGREGASADEAVYTLTTDDMRAGNTTWRRYF